MITNVSFAPEADAFVIPGIMVASGKIVIINGIHGMRLHYSDSVRLPGLGINLTQGRKGRMCDLDNKECKDLIELLTAYQEYVGKKHIDDKIKTYITKLQPYAGRVNSDGTVSDLTEYDTPY